MPLQIIKMCALVVDIILLLQKLNPDISQYRDRRFPGTQEDFEKCLGESTTLYLGNLSFYTTEEQIYEVPSGPLHFYFLVSGVQPIACAFAFIVKIGIEPTGFCCARSSHEQAILSGSSWGSIRIS